MNVTTYVCPYCERKQVVRSPVRGYVFPLCQECGVDMRPLEAVEPLGQGMRPPQGMLPLTVAARAAGVPPSSARAAAAAGRIPSVRAPLRPGLTRRVYFVRPADLLPLKRPHN